MGMKPGMPMPKPKPKPKQKPKKQVLNRQQPISYVFGYIAYNELYCWLRVEESLTTLSFSEYEKQQIRTFENAIEEGLIVNNIY